METTLTCINCPVGCRVQATIENGVCVRVSGNGCKLGEKYAMQESVRPLRMVTAVVPVEGARCPVSVKTRSPIPKEDIARCMAELSQLRLRVPVHMGDVVLPNAVGSGVDVIATKTVE